MEMVLPLTVVGGEVGNTAAVEILSQQSSGVRRVSQGCGGSLHVGEGADEGGGVRDVVDGGRLDAESAHSHRDLTVGVALVGLGNHLVDVAGDVRGDRGKLGGVVELDAVGHHRGAVPRPGVHRVQL